MQIISDLHLHSKHSRGCSKNLDLTNLEKYGKIKGLGLLGTSDFTHPIWQKELKSKLIEDETGIAKTKTGFPFVYQTEISLIYSSKGKGRRIHNVVLAPSFEVVTQITDELKKKGRVDYDGRPIFKIPCPDFVEMLRGISKEIEVIPAHIWTPHFSLLGEYNQFRSVSDGFEDQTKHIHALETGISSDPAMNMRVSVLDKFNLVSFSDSHSFWPWRMGREATTFELARLTYKNLIKALRSNRCDNPSKNRISETLEVNPSYGKYHFDGHRKCGVCFDPVQSRKHSGICPVCKKGLTIGVMNRVEELASPDRPEGFVLKNVSAKFKSIMPLHELLSNLYCKGLSTKLVWAEYNKLLKLGSEFDILLNKSFEELSSVSDFRIAQAILKNREGTIEVKPGFDGEYGIPCFPSNERMI
ncbi:DNA helicase UvrD [Candidatus Woesearchaeota archaeon]|jgi:uncharacterized protein (TIGR00375 family)|nr:DNA helicase UvrD [Candidatus Woesearchaeota archaeon]